MARPAETGAKHQTPSVEIPLVAGGVGRLRFAPPVRELEVDNSTGSYVAINVNRADAPNYHAASFVLNESPGTSKLCQTLPKLEAEESSPEPIEFVTIRLWPGVHPSDLTVRGVPFDREQTKGKESILEENGYAFGRN